MKVFKIFLGVALLFSLSAQAEENKHKLGLMLGNVGLAGDAGNYGNALGYGGFFDWAASDMFELELGYISSNHTGGPSGTSLTQSDFSVGVLYNLVSYDVLTPYLAGGVNMVSRNLNAGSTLGTFSASGFGLHVGAGVDFQLADSASAGLIIRYVNAFDQNASNNGVTIKLIQPYTDIMARFAFRFN